MIYYNKQDEVLYLVNEIIYSPKYNKKGEITHHAFSVKIEIEYENNPPDPKTGQATKPTMGLPPNDKYDVRNTSKADAETYFRQSLIRQCLGTAKEISQTDAKQIQDNWNLKKCAG